MTIVYGYLIAWIAGGVALMTMLLLRLRPAWLALPFALIGYGAAGFVAHGLGSALAPIMAGAAAIALGGLGYALGRI